MKNQPITLRNRREFLEFFGKSSVKTALGLSALTSFPFLIQSCASLSRKNRGLPFQSMGPVMKDDLVLVPGLQYEILLKWDDVLNSKGERFGFNNDFLQFFPIEGKSNEGVLWVNHEYTSPLFIQKKNIDLKAKRIKSEVLEEMKTVGGSLVHLKKDSSTGKWKALKKSEFNRRVTGLTPIPFAWDEPIQGSTKGIGTLGNCAGGRTPWGTVLTCEENFQDFYTDVEFSKDGKRTPKENGSDFINWSSVFNYPPEHYGWVVEVNPFTGSAKKLVSIGRFGHECATVRKADNGRCAVYSGDDSQDRCIYKFISDKEGSLERGTLHVAQIETGTWIPLDLEKTPVLKNHFNTQTEVLMYARQAAEIVGGTKCDRPEDIEVCPRTGAVYITLTNNVKRGNYFGSILKIEESGNDPLGLAFKSSTFLAGGPDSHMACPDNLVFDPAGNLWVTSDISGSKLGKAQYAPFGNNGLFFIPMSGPNAGTPFQVASAPNDAELTGPCFSPDGETLFLSVQHPGEETKKWGEFTSHWPLGGKEVPRSSVVAISGPLLQAIYQWTKEEN
jgi:uncharacterized protein